MEVGEFLRQNKILYADLIVASDYKTYSLASLLNSFKYAECLPKQNFLYMKFCNSSFKTYLSECIYTNNTYSFGVLVNMSEYDTLLHFKENNFKVAKPKNNVSNKDFDSCSITTNSIYYNDSIYIKSKHDILKEYEENGFTKIPSRVLTKL